VLQAESEAAAAVAAASDEAAALTEATRSAIRVVH
jgi:hypothetical protein